MSDNVLNDISYNLNLMVFLEFRKECDKLISNCSNADNYCLNKRCFKDNLHNICVDCFKTFKKLIK